MLGEIGRAYAYAAMTPLALWCVGFFLTVWLFSDIVKRGWSVFIISSGRKKGLLNIWLPLLGLAGIGLMGFAALSALRLVTNVLMILYGLILAAATVGAVIGTLRFGSKMEPPRPVRNSFGLIIFAMGFGPLINSLIEFRFPPGYGVGIPVALLVIIVNLGVGSYILWKNDALEHVTWAKEQLSNATAPAAGDTGAQDPP